MIPEQIEHYATGGQRVAQAIKGLTAVDLAIPSEPGKWSIGQVVVHLADAEMALSDRMKRVIATENPYLLAWDENAFKAALHYDAQSVEDAAAMIDLVRRQMARVLRKVHTSAFARVGTHSKDGRKTLLELMAGADIHLEHHLKFVAEKRERLGKLMW